MKANSFLSLVTVMGLLVLGSCDDDNYELIHDRMRLLVDNTWGNAQIIKESGNAYGIALPTIFRRDKTVYMGGTTQQWKFMDNGNSIKIIYPANPDYFQKWAIVKLTESEFHFKQFNREGQFLVELIYTSN